MWFIKTIFYKETLYFLTDEDLFKKKTLAGKAPPRVWGCDTAVRIAKGIPAEEGKVVAYADFWDATTLPDELRPLCVDVDTFMWTWGECWRTVFCKSQLCHTIKRAPEPWKEAAWEELLRREHVGLHLMWLLIDPHSTEEVQARAWAEFQNKNPTVRELDVISTDTRVLEHIRTEASRYLSRHT